MLGHDLRSPLQTIQIAASYQAALNAGAKISEAASRLMNSGARMNALLNDMLDFNRARLGLGIHIAPKDVDVGVLFAKELDQLRSVNHTHRLNLESPETSAPLGMARVFSNYSATWCGCN